MAALACGSANRAPRDSRVAVRVERVIGMLLWQVGWRYAPWPETGEYTCPWQGMGKVAMLRPNCAGIMAANAVS